MTMPAFPIRLPKSIRRHPRRSLLAGLVVLVIIILGLWLAFGRSQPNLNSVSVIKADVSRHYVLPTNEQPALATITNKAKLSSNFFKQAQDGDKVLIYQKNQVAIIYRPSIDRIIAVGPVSIDTPPTGSDTSQ